ncbi:MAG: hypothetical protein JWN70_1745 [Planctomycetaceae bacterium]|nr:hypothetical protein [Planctomycetaceae bacterium]
MRLSASFTTGLWLVLSSLAWGQTADKDVRINIKPPPISTDASVKYDYDIVYVRGKRRADDKEAAWAEFSRPTTMEPGADLMLLHPDGSEELLVSGEDGSVMDPYVSFDGQSVYYAKFIDAKHSGADIHRIHVPTRKTVRLTDQTFTPNTGAAPWSSDYRSHEEGKTSLSYGVYNVGPCPLPGGRVMYSSNRNAYLPPRGYPRHTLQLHVMDDDGANIEQIGYFNIACALHPVILRDGRVLFSSLESQGIHNSIMWGIWSIHPDGTNWNPVISAFENDGAPSAYHFQTQLSDGSIVIEKYYNQNQKGFGTLFKLPETPPADRPPFGPGDRNDPRNRVSFIGVDGREQAHAVPFSPAGMELITPWIHWEDRPSPPAISRDEKSPRIGKVTHPCGAPDNHLLVAWTLGPIGGSSGAVQDHMVPRIIDSGLYLIRKGGTTREPGDMLLIKNDPRYNEQWPRPLVSYERMYGVKEPKQLIHKNDGNKHPQLAEGTPFGLVGTSSLYKRESAPGGRVPEGSVTAVASPKNPESWYWSAWRTNWALQGSDAGIFDNSEIHAIRILAQEPRTDIDGNANRPRYGNHAMERLRILGEIPVRKFSEPGNGQPNDPDGHPDTSFLAKIPANQSFTFQLIDKEGMTLTMAQTWHQVRPGETRYDCGGCHAHSQQPTPFELTAASRADYKLFDLTSGKTPLLTDQARDESKHQWDEKNQTGLRYVSGGVLNVEYLRDIKPILERSCVACHTHKAEKPAGNLVLDDDQLGNENAFGADAVREVPVPKTYFRLASWERYKQPPAGMMVTPQCASPYITMFQSRRSLLAWKIYGRRLDGYSNEDYPSVTRSGDLKSLIGAGGKPIEKLDYNDANALADYVRRYNIDMDYTGSIMPPPDAVRAGKVQPLSDEERRTIVRWIDLGCPIDIDPQYNPAKPDSRSFGWLGDDQRPTLTLTYPTAGENQKLSRILIGMADAYTGIDASSFQVTADFAVDGIAPGENLAGHFQALPEGRWEWKLARAVTDLPAGTLTVSIKDRQGNINSIKRRFSVTSLK